MRSGEGQPAVRGRGRAKDSPPALIEKVCRFVRSVVCISLLKKQKSIMGKARAIVCLELNKNIALGCCTNVQSATVNIF